MFLHKFCHSVSCCVISVQYCDWEMNVLIPESFMAICIIVSRGSGFEIVCIPSSVARNCKQTFLWISFCCRVLSVQYYDWETNVCHRYDWLEDNSFSQVESDTEIPVDVDPSQESQYFPDFEPQRLERMVSM